MSVLVLHCHVP